MVGAALTAAWLLVIRSGAAPLRASGLFTWLAFAGTIGGSALLQRALVARIARGISRAR